MKPKSKATDAYLPTNLLALFGLYAIWKALSAPSRFDMPAGAGYKAAMELKGQGWDAREIKAEHEARKKKAEAISNAKLHRMLHEQYKYWKAVSNLSDKALKAKFGKYCDPY